MCNHVWSWDDDNPGYSKCLKCFSRRNEEA